MKNNIYTFNVKPEAILRYFSLYIVVAISSAKELKIYSGKTGDNRKGCNPILSRCGNHFSYNNAHSQLRNKINNYYNFEYQYFYTHFQEYKEGEDNRAAIDEINELERLLLIQVKEKFINVKGIQILNEFKGKLKKNNEIYHKNGKKEKVNLLVSSAYDYIINAKLK